LKIIFIAALALTLAACARIVADTGRGMIAKRVNKMNIPTGGLT